ncbi:Maf/Ham1 [Cadophora sp. DSE1049]|nr:Maf/Ham1 [Cadophora sp. DSE1049]
MESPTASSSNIEQIIVASKNPVKVSAALKGFQAMFPSKSYTAKGISVPSGVADQPFTSKETLQGALNRAQNAREQEPNADYWIGLEGGVEDTPEKTAGSLELFAWIVVIGKDGRVGKARTGSYYLPEEVARLVRGGMELGPADDLVFGQTNSKQGDGNVGLLTGNAVTRETAYVPTVVMALIPFRNHTLTF